MIGDTFINVEATYGRKYSTVEEAQQDWEDGKDFRVQIGGMAINKDDWLQHAPEKKITIYLGNGRYETLQRPQS